MLPRASALILVVLPALSLFACQDPDPSNVSAGTDTTATTATNGTDATTGTTTGTDTRTTIGTTETTAASTTSSDEVCGCLKRSPDSSFFVYSCDPLTECGTFVIHTDQSLNDPCAEGGDPEACEALTTSNAAVVECALAAITADEPFAVGRSEDPGNQFSKGRSFWVPGDGTMPTTSSSFSDLCSSSSVALWEAPEFDACADWSCIEAGLFAASTIESCAFSEGCDDF